MKNREKKESRIKQEHIRIVLMTFLLFLCMFKAAVHAEELVEENILSENVFEEEIVEELLTEEYIDVSASNEDDAEAITDYPIETEQMTEICLIEENFAYGDGQEASNQETEPSLWFYTDESGDSPYVMPQGTIKKRQLLLSAGNLERAATGFSYADQLDGEARGVYDVMSACWGNCKGAETISYTLIEPVCFEAQGEIVDGEFVWSGRSDENYMAVLPEIKRAVQSAVDAFLYDHPEVYWFSKSGYATGQDFEILEDGTVRGTIDEVRVTGVERWAGASGDLGLFDCAVAECVNHLQESGITNLSAPEQLKVIHDYIVDVAQYGTNTYAHTAYGFFAADARAIVCDGYAKAFKILCDRLGLPCVLVGGSVNKGSASEGHMWNYVLVADHDADGNLNDGNLTNGNQTNENLTDENQWYLVDVTWDDNNSSPYMYFLAGEESQGVYGTVGEERIVSQRFSQSEFTQTFHVPVLAAQMLHTWKADTVVAANCIKDGYEIDVCSLCAKSRVLELTDGKHTWPEKWTVTKAASCTGHGLEEKKCSLCAEKISRTIPSTGHRAGKEVILKEPTVLAMGSKAVYCEVCGELLNTISVEKLKPTIKLNRKKASIQIGKKKKLFRVTCLAKGDYIVKWRSANTRIVRVNRKGYIKGKRKGKTYIYVTLKSGLKRKMKVIVK